MRFMAVFNKDGGTLRTMDLEELRTRTRNIFTNAGHELDFAIVAGKDVEQALRRAAEDPMVEVIMAGGGDGTISTAAALAFEHDKALAVLPAGTMNLFAHALHMPLDLDEALLGLAAGDVERVDIATANGRPFVHQFGVGIHARLVRIRNGMVYRSRLGKMSASLRAIIAATVDPPHFAAEFHSPNGSVTREVSGIAVSNNPLGNDPVPVAERLDAGVLGVYLAARVTTRDLLGLVFDVFNGRWRSNNLVSETEVEQLVLRFPARKRNAHAVIDGELIPLAHVVELRIHPGGLKIVRPPASKADAGRL